MTFLEAVSAIEKRASELRLVDPFGDALEPIEAMGVVAKFHGGVWSEIDADLLAGRISPDQYADACLLLIDEFARYQVRRRIEQAIVRVRRTG